MRFFGLGAIVMQKLGVQTQLLQAGEIFQALQLGTIDATEFSMPAMDLTLGFHQVAKHYYFPGWHQMATFTRSDRLEAEVGRALRHAEGDQSRSPATPRCCASYAEGEAVQAKAIKEIKSKGVTVHYWPKEMLDAVPQDLGRGRRGAEGQEPRVQEGWASLFGVPRGIQDLARLRLSEGLGRLSRRAVPTCGRRAGAFCALMRRSHRCGSRSSHARLTEASTTCLRARPAVPDLLRCVLPAGRPDRLHPLLDAIKWLLEKVAFASGWLLIVLMFITCMDIIGRKLGIPIPLTKFQELEWHMHTALFSMWMGYNYTINAHPRVDSYTETLRFRTKAWIEFWGCPAAGAPVPDHHAVYHGWTSSGHLLRAERGLRERDRPALPLDHQGRLLRRPLAACCSASSACCCA